MKKTTKAQRILKLYDGKRTTREIANTVGCMPEYVRVVARQRKGTRQSAIDLRYLEAGGREKARRRDKINRARRAEARSEARP